ncbi:MAG: hypothetical protein FJ221_12425 [Lentisphaerae bacterium]|nr:hypothetical protein [Lentisphaerota bacterium]
MMNTLLVAVLLAVAAGPRAVHAAADRKPPSEAEKARMERQKEKDARRAEKERERVDLNHDGIVDASEAEASKNSWYREQGLRLDGSWEALADTDKDGKLSAAEMYEFKKSLLDDDKDGSLSPDDYRRFLKRVRSLVQTPRERGFDRNKDGFLEGGEVLAMLRDRLSGLRGTARRPVESKFDRLFDSNVDGHLSSDESGAIELAIEEQPGR